MATTYGTPVRLDIGGADFDLGTEVWDGRYRMVALAIDNGDRCIDLALSPDGALRLGEELTRLAST
jgi:hypothetical protein